MSEFKITIPHTYTFKEGWGVFVEPEYSGEDDRLGPRVTDIHVEVVRIDKEHVEVIGGLPCVWTSLDIGVPVKSFLDVLDLTEDDTHDLRCRYFATKSAAEEGATTVKDLWEHPNPWTAFVRVS